MTTQGRTGDLEALKVQMAHIEEAQLQARFQIRDSLWSLKEAVKQVRAIEGGIESLRCEVEQRVAREGERFDRGKGVPEEKGP